MKTVAYDAGPLRVAGTPASIEFHAINPLGLSSFFLKARRLPVARIEKLTGTIRSRPVNSPNERFSSTRLPFLRRTMGQP